MSADTAHAAFDSSKAARDEKLNQALVGEPFITGSQPGGGPRLEGAPDSDVPDVPRFDYETPASGIAEKFNQGLIGEKFITGAMPGGGPEMNGADSTISQIQSAAVASAIGSSKGSEGAHPVVLGGHYDQDYKKPSEEQNFDEVHGHKTDMPVFQRNEGSGFDKDWQYENKA